MLIQNGACVDTKDNHGQTLLQQALKLKNLQMIKELLKNGAFVHAKGTNGNRPLILALENGLVEVAELLIKNGANINTQCVLTEKSPKTLWTLTS